MSYLTQSYKVFLGVISANSFKNSL